MAAQWVQPMYVHPMHVSLFVHVLVHSDWLVRSCAIKDFSISNDGRRIRSDDQCILSDLSKVHAGPDICNVS